MLEELITYYGTVVVILIVAYYIIKWAVKNGINETVLGKYSTTNNIAKNESENSRIKKFNSNSNIKDREQEKNLFTILFLYK